MRLALLAKRLILVALAVGILALGGMAVLSFAPALLVVASVFAVHNRGPTRTTRARPARAGNKWLIVISTIIGAVSTFVYDIATAIRGPANSGRRPRHAGTFHALTPTPLRL